MSYFKKSNQYYLGQLVDSNNEVTPTPSGIIPVGDPKEGDTVRYSEFTGEWTVKPESTSSTTGLIPISEGQLLARKIGSGTGLPEAASADDASLILDTASDPFLRKSSLNPIELPTWTGPFSRNLTAVALIPGTQLSITPGWWMIDYTGMLDTTVQTNGGNWQVNFSAGGAGIGYFSGFVSMAANVGDGNTTPLRSIGTTVLVGSCRFLTGNKFAVKVLLKATSAGDIDLRLGSETAGQTVSITELHGVAIRQSF
jgi:hypothetical protein